ncbi:hypothetical protein AJ79_00877 [Helicocarpus griseus UAMH5409]|uniref:DUF7605 domain-containing protein n=1 Tax=Helicocarpus griseus UAMH5409 TaxID=1447875 RepID=A0A2B7Y8A0_9EURO|nr:hypothetical protein AJ79_00877 [Helicocarpus griseus UAMH5409]
MFSDDDDVEMHDGQAADPQQKWLDASLKRKQLDHRKKQIDSEIKLVGQQLGEATQTERRKQEVFALRCILNRNEEVKADIRRDFADGIRQLDETDADEESFVPTVELRDYDHLARSLPVFCVSSKAYQKLEGRLRRDRPIETFSKSADTEIPDLQAHCLDLTVCQRKASCQAFLNGLEQLINSLSLLCSSKRSSGTLLCEEQKKADRVFLESRLDILQQNLENLAGDIMDEIADVTQSNISDKFGLAASQPCNKAGDALAGWNRSRKDSPEALAWNTYRAICRRQGVYKHHNWNDQLAQPMIGVLRKSWERAFSKSIPKIFAQFGEFSSSYMATFHEDVDAPISTRSIASDISEQLKAQVETYQTSLKELATSGKKIFENTQKAAYRSFVPIIAAELEEAYDDCGSATGQGVLLRMKDIMTRRVGEGREEIFRKSTTHVQNELRDSLESAKDLMVTGVDKIFQKISCDYKNAFAQSQTAEEEALDRELRNLLQNVTMFKVPASSS